MTFPRKSINRGRGGSLTDRPNPLKKTCFSLSAVLFSAYDVADRLLSDGDNAGEMVISSSSISSPCAPIEYWLPLPATDRQYYMVISQSTSNCRGNTMPSITPEEYWCEYWSPPRRKVLRVVVRPSKRDWVTPAEPRRTQKPQLLCARCGRTWNPRLHILRAGRLPRKCPHCSSPLWNKPYVRRVSRKPSSPRERHTEAI